MNLILSVVLAVAVTLGYGLAGSSDIEMEIDNQEEYCEMVTLYITSQGENGWPDYNNSYETECFIQDTSNPTDLYCDAEVCIEVDAEGMEDLNQESDDTNLLVLADTKTYCRYLYKGNLETDYRSIGDTDCEGDL